ncbi:MAG: FAD-binding oxidoreductase [Gammaproteobacteria bacterium]
MNTPSHTKYLVIGAGIHGLSTAYHLALQLEERGLGKGEDILVVDKRDIGAGASGIACGVVRNNYFQPAMRKLMAHSVDVWERDPKAYTYRSVGYLQISSEVMHKDVATIAEQQKEIGYESVFIEGEKDSMKYMRDIFDDWQAQNITSVLHEKRGGYANNIKSCQALAAKARNEGVNILTGVKVTGFRFANGSRAIKAVETDQGTIECDYVIVGAGPWVKQIWDMLELPKKIDVNDGQGRTHKDIPMWVFWSLQEGTLGVDPRLVRTNDGKRPPVVHVDTDAPLYSIRDGSLITDKMWGIYYKPDPYFGGVQGGAAPNKVETDSDEVKIDPYGLESPDFIVGEDFANMWCSALAHCQKRFEDKYPLYKKEPSGGIGAFSPDNFPVFDVFRQNCYIIADSNHGYKMIGVGELVAEEILGGKNELLEPFRFARYETGELHPTSHSPFPWS